MPPGRLGHELNQPLYVNHVPTLECGREYPHPNSSFLINNLRQNYNLLNLQPNGDPVASSLVLVKMSMRGLLSVYMMKLLQ